MGIFGQIIEILGQIIGFLFAYYLLRLAYKLYGKNHFPGAVMAAWAAVVILLCSSQWFQVWAKSFIASNITAKLNEFGQQLNSIQKITMDMQNQLAGNQAKMDKLRTELDEIQSKILDAETNVNTVQGTAAEMRNQLASHQTEIDNHQKELDEVQSQVRDGETNALNQQSVFAKQFQQISAVQSELASAGTNLSAHEKRLSDLERWIKQVYGKMNSDASTNLGTNN
jgi:peptidoglycan hydrolase CwlO-like protein